MAFETFDDTLLGSANDDTLIGGDDADVIGGGAGDDLLVGGKDKDTVWGGDGDDIVIGGEYASGAVDIDVVLTEDTGLDIVYLVRPVPEGLAETLIGGAGADVIIGGNWQDLDEDGAVDYTEIGFGDDSLEYQPGFANKIWGGAGNDTVYGANGFDTIGGGAGDDQLNGAGGVDVIYGGAGNDLIFGGSGEPQYFHQFDREGDTRYEMLYGGTGNDTVWGGDDEDRIFGGADDDDLYGGDGDDTVSGGAGNDMIYGHEGDDVLSGGDGEDYFFFGEKEGADVITDFDVSDDRLYFEHIENQAMIDEFLDMAEETTVDGEAGLLITVSGGVSVFLVGLGADDIDNINAVAGPLFVGTD